MILRVLLDSLNLSFLLQVIWLNWNWEIVFIVLFDLDYHTDSHCLLCEGHLSDFMEEWAREFDCLNRIHSIESAYLDKSKLLHIVISNKDIIFIAANAWRKFACLDQVILCIDSLVVSKKLFSMLCNLKFSNVDRDIIEIAFVGDEVQIKIILHRRYRFNYCFILLFQYLTKFERNGLHFESYCDNIELIFTV